MSVEISLLKIKNRISNIIETAIDEKHMRMIAEFGRQLVVNRSMLGGLVDGDKRLNNPKFSPFYKKFREINADSLHSRTTPSKSNVTFSGQLLDSIQVTKVTKTQAVISAVGDRKPYKVFTLFPYTKPANGKKGATGVININGKLYKKSNKKYTQKKIISNTKLLMYLAKQGRRIMGFTKAEQSQLIKEFKRQFTDILKKI